MLASVMSVVTLAIAVVLVRTANSKQLTNDALRRKRFKRATVNWWFWRCSPGGALDTRNAARGYALEDPKALPTLASPKSLPGAERAVTGTGGAAEPLLLRLPAQPDPPPGESVGPNSDSATQHPPDGVPPEPM